MAGNDHTGYWDPLVMQQGLTEAEKQIRDNFVTEYLKDYDPWKAAVRAGYVRTISRDYAELLIQEPYVQQEIARRKAVIPDNPKELRKQKEHNLEQLLWEMAHDKGEGSTLAARVSAAKALQDWYDKKGTVKVQSEVTHRGGIMVVPGIASVDEWEKQAAASQDALIASSAEDRGTRPLH